MPQLPKQYLSEENFMIEKFYFFMDRVDTDLNRGNRESKFGLNVHGEMNIFLNPFPTMSASNDIFFEQSACW